MEEFKKKNSADITDKEIVFSQSIKAGKRIYYLDVKKNKKDELFLAITESKKIVTNEGDENQQVSFEKHKIFLYKEDFEKFLHSLQQAIQFIQSQQSPLFKQTENNQPQETTNTSEEENESLGKEIKIDIDF